MTGGDAKRAHDVQQKQQRELDELLWTTLKEEWARNAAIWVGVVIGSFVVVMLVLIVVTGA